jgi:hypothetical protein
MKLTTNDEENDQKSKEKWTRGDSRGILTDLERKNLEQGTVNRHQRLNIKTKTLKAIDDLSLILSTHTEPFDVRPFSDIEPLYDLNGLESYLKDLIFILYRLHERRLTLERRKKKTKGRATSKQVWKVVNRTLKGAKIETNKKCKKGGSP